MGTKNTTRYQWVDIAKGIAIILVVYGHVVRGVYNAKLPIGESFYTWSDSFVYSFHMPLFFILAGLFFGSSLQKYKAKGLVSEKFKTILYPFIIWSVIQTFVEMILSNYTNGNTTISDLLYCLIIPRAQFWFLFALFFMNVINVLLSLVFKEKWKLVSLFISLICYFAPIDLNVFTNTFKFLIFFNLGILGAEFILKGPLLQYLNQLRFFLLSTILFLASFMISTNYHFLSLIPAVLGSLVVIQIAYFFMASRFSSAFSRLGALSFEIYILHILVAAGTRVVLMKIFHVESIVLHVLIGTLSGVFIPFILTALFNRYAWYRNLFRLPNWNK